MEHEDKNIDKPTAPELNGAANQEPAPHQEAEPGQPQTTETPKTTLGDQLDKLRMDDPEEIKPPDQKPRWPKRWLHWYTHHKKLSLPLTLLVIIAALAAVPFSRYALAGMVMQQDFTITVRDRTTHQPVSKVHLRLDNQTAETDSAGRAKLHVSVGQHELSLSKKYYHGAEQKVLVPITGHGNVTVELTATGRQVPVTVTNKLTGQPLADAVIAAAGTEAKTNQKGQAVIVLPTGETKLSATLTAEGYNDAKTQLTVTGQDVPGNHLTLTPSGQVYFLSKLSGKIDVVKTNLDGTGRQTVLAGTGYEDDNTTTLLASRDWKYLTLLSQRKANDTDKLFLINTSNDAVSVIDPGNAQYTPVGWYGDHFVYTAYNKGVANWQPHRQALKTFDASTARLSTIDQTDGSGTSDLDFAYDSFDKIEIVDGQIIYYKNWSSSQDLTGKTVDVIAVKPDGSDKKVLKSFPASASYFYGVSVAQYAPDGLYLQLPLPNGSNDYYDISDGQISPDATISPSQFAKNRPTYLVSPDGSQTFWSERRDGKFSLFVGDAHGQHAKQIASLSDYAAYGWFGSYLLVSKGGNELFVMSPDGKVVTKISDYHKINYDFGDYGYGYGGN